MQKEELKSYKVPVGFFLLGVLFLIIGANGNNIATTVSRPGNADSWTTSEGLINAFTSIPMIIGIVFLVLFICTFSISFYQLQKKR